ncbi:hypothetical protein AAHE18_15G149400 [Arachis hypogaea]
MVLLCITFSLISLSATIIITSAINPNSELHQQIISAKKVIRIMHVNYQPLMATLSLSKSATTQIELVVLIDSGRKGIDGERGRIRPQTEGRSSKNAGIETLITSRRRRGRILA